MTKKLEKGSAWDKADTNGDNIITDAELDAQLTAMDDDEEDE